MPIRRLTRNSQASRISTFGKDGGATNNCAELEGRSARCQPAPSLARAQREALPFSADDVPIYHGALLGAALGRRGGSSGRGGIRQVSGADGQEHAYDDA